MGSQQLLLVVLGMVITGIAITVAITMFQANAIESSRTAMIEDLLFLAGRARDYYLRPAAMGGGGRNFSGLTSIRQLSAMTYNENGSYSLYKIAPHELELKGIGKIVANDGYSIEVILRMNEQTSTIKIVH